MATKALHIRVEEKLKKDADIVFEDLGLDTPTAVRLFLRQVVTTGSIPFQLKSSRTVNGFTPKFEEEVLRTDQEKELIGPFESADDAIAELHKHAE